MIPNYGFASYASADRTAELRLDFDGFDFRILERDASSEASAYVLAKAHSLGFVRMFDDPREPGDETVEVDDDGMVTWWLRPRVHVDDLI